MPLYMRHFKTCLKETQTCEQELARVQSGEELRQFEECVAPYMSECKHLEERLSICSISREERRVLETQLSRVAREYLTEVEHEAPELHEIDMDRGVRSVDPTCDWRNIDTIWYVRMQSVAMCSGISMPPTTLPPTTTKWKLQNSPTKNYNICSTS
mmetsp:Transcript_9803/g.36572  ORF Transcript_9803/g.36572 Transcript_9803/m.36572 type:complete len:156 (-) Transcript_9803:3690-4157(-)